MEQLGYLRGMNSHTRRQWEARAKEWVASGQTAIVFAASRGINPNTLAHWKWRLGAEARGGGGVDVPAFLEVIRPVGATSSRPPSSNPAGSLQVILPGDLRICVPPDFDAAALRRLVAALEVR